MSLLDTDVVPELRRRHRIDPEAAEWADSVSRSELFLSSVSIPELETVTRNRVDFEPMGVTVLNPWE